MKTILIIIFILVVLGAGWYLISPAFRVEERDDPFPSQPVREEEIIREPEVEPMVKDMFESMPPEVKEQFEKAVEEMKDKEIPMEEVMPPTSTISAQGEFMPRAHEVAGRALLIEHGSMRTLRFEDFETINGPNLHIYLASDLSSDDFVDLGPIRATKGNVNYELTPDIDTSRYNKVLVWCVPFGVLFSYAELMSI